MRQQVGARVQRLFTTGVVQSLGNGAVVNGLSDGEVLRAERITKAGLRPWGRGRSLTLTLLMNGDPTWRITNAPIMQWSRAVWWPSSVVNLQRTHGNQ